MSGVLAKLRGVARGGFIHAVAVLVGGTAVAHLIIALTLPVVTRLYSPEDFSILALFTAVVAIISVAACLRFDIAVPIPESDGEAANVFALAIVSSSSVSAVLALIVIAAPRPVAALLGQPHIAAYLWLVPIAVLLASTYSALQFWFIRRKAFREIATTRIAQATAAAMTQIALGLLRLSPFGLLAGHALNVGAGCAGLGLRFAWSESAQFRHVTCAGMRKAFRKYSRFPKFSTMEALLNATSIYLPVILISSLASGPEAGFVILAMQVMQAPMSLIGSAIAQVYMSRAPEEFRAQRLGAFTTSVVGGLMRSGVGPLIFAGLTAQHAFALVFGEEWRPSGELVLWMTPWFVMQFVSSPISMSLHVTGNQKTALALQIAGVILRTGAVWLAHLAAPLYIAEAYSLSGFVFYALYTATVLGIIGIHRAEIAREITLSARLIGLWLGAGICISLIGKMAGS